MKKKINEKLKLTSFYKSYLETLNYNANKINIKNLFNAVKLIEDTVKKKKIIYMFVVMEDLLPLLIIIFVIILNNSLNILI